MPLIPLLGIINRWKNHVLPNCDVYQLKPAVFSGVDKIQKKIMARQKLTVNELPAFHQDFSGNPKPEQSQLFCP